MRKRGKACLLLCVKPHLCEAGGINRWALYFGHTRLTIRGGSKVLFISDVSVRKGVVLKLGSARPNFSHHHFFYSELRMQTKGSFEKLKTYIGYTLI